MIAEHSIKVPGTDTMTLSKDAIDYIKRFPYYIDVQAGHVYDAQFKDFMNWCNQTLGIKFKDWYLMNNGKQTYRLHMRDSKYSMFLTLKYSDIIIGSNLR